MKNKCFYHNKDHDGICSAAIIYNEFPDCEMVGVDYDEEFPWEKITPEDRIFMVDYSRPTWQEMMKIEETCSEFIWIDHHQSIIKKMTEQKKRLSKYKVGTDKAACELTWLYFHGEEDQIPLGITLLGQYDRWDHSNPLTVPFEMGMRSFDSDPKSSIWKKVFCNDMTFIKDTISKGNSIIQYQKEVDEWNMKKSFPFEWEGIKFICINSVYTGSPQFDSVWDPEKYDAVMVFYLSPDFKWNIRMYTSKEGINLAKIATKYGGGGHWNACGCKINELPFLNRYYSKE